MSESLKQTTFAEGLLRLARALQRMEARLRAPAKPACSCENNGDLCAFCEQQAADRDEVACPRCEEWPCLCGNPDFEAWVSAELDKAEREGRD